MKKRPWWITAVVVAMVAAGVTMPLIVAAHGDAAEAIAGETGLLIKFFPAYAVAAGICAWLCWPRRKELTWILLGLLLLSSVFVILLPL